MARCTWTMTDARTGVELQCTLEDTNPLHVHNLDWSLVRTDEELAAARERDAGVGPV